MIVRIVNLGPAVRFAPLERVVTGNAPGVSEPIPV